MQRRFSVEYEHLFVFRTLRKLIFLYIMVVCFCRTERQKKLFKKKNHRFTVVDWFRWPTYGSDNIFLVYRTVIQLPDFFFYENEI